MKLLFQNFLTIKKIIKMYALTNFKNIKIDFPTVICGNVVKDSIIESVERIRKINKDREDLKRENGEIITLITKEELILYLVLKNVVEHKRENINFFEAIHSLEDFIDDNIDENINFSEINILDNNVLEKCINRNYKELEQCDIGKAKYYKKHLENRLNYFFQCLRKFTKVDIPITYDIELFKVFAPILEVVRYELETDLDLSFFHNFEVIQNEEQLELKERYKKIEKYINKAITFNKLIEQYSGILINYLNNSNSKYEYENILFITDNISCFKSLFGNCNEEKLICLYQSLENEDLEELSKEYDIIVTNSKNKRIEIENVFYLSENSIFSSEILSIIKIN